MTSSGTPSPATYKRAQPDALGQRLLLGVVTPSTNTIVQPEYDAMRPMGVTNHLGRIHLPNLPTQNDADFGKVMQVIDDALMAAIDSVMTCHPDYLVLGISSESIWGGGLEKSRSIDERVRAKYADIRVAQAAQAFPAALKAFGVKKRISVITPYYPVADPHIRAYVDEIGYEVVRSKHLSCVYPTDIACVSPVQLKDAMREVDGDDVECIIQFGADLACGRVAAEAEVWLNKPVIAVNTATYWYALRQNGINDQFDGFGSLLRRF